MFRWILSQLPETPKDGNVWQWVSYGIGVIGAIVLGIIAYLRASLVSKERALEDQNAKVEQLFLKIIEGQDRRIEIQDQRHQEDNRGHAEEHRELVNTQGQIKDALVKITTELERLNDELRRNKPDTKH